MFETSLTVDTSQPLTPLSKVAPSNIPDISSTTYCLSGVSWNHFQRPMDTAASLRAPLQLLTFCISQLFIDLHLSNFLHLHRVNCMLVALVGSNTLPKNCNPGQLKNVLSINIVEVLAVDNAIPEAGSTEVRDSIFEPIE